MFYSTHKIGTIVDGGSHCFYRHSHRVSDFLSKPGDRSTRPHQLTCFTIFTMCNGMVLSPCGKTLPFGTQQEIHLNTLETLGPWKRIREISRGFYYAMIHPGIYKNRSQIRWIRPWSQHDSQLSDAPSAGRRRWKPEIGVLAQFQRIGSQVDLELFEHPNAHGDAPVLEPWHRCLPWYYTILQTTPSPEIIS